MKIQATVIHDITIERIRDILCCAFEGGSNYWYVINEFIKPDKILTEDGKSEKKEDDIFRHLDYPTSPGGALVIGDMEEGADEPGNQYTLNLTTIEKGVKIMAKKYPTHFADFINENDDAITGDVFLQCCLFGECVYG